MYAQPSLARDYAGKSYPLNMQLYFGMGRIGMVKQDPQDLSKYLAITFMPDEGERVKVIESRQEADEILRERLEPLYKHKDDSTPIVLNHWVAIDPDTHAIIHKTRLNGEGAYRVVLHRISDNKIAAFFMESFDAAVGFIRAKTLPPEVYWDDFKTWFEKSLKGNV